MALFWGIQEYIALDANNITLVFDSGNIVNISGNIFLYPPQGHPILYNYSSLFISVYSSVDGQSVGLVGTFGHSWGTDTGLPVKLAMPPR